MKFHEMRFVAVEGVDVPDPFAPPSGPRRVIGKTFSPEAGGMVLMGEVALVRLNNDDFHHAQGLFRKCVEKKELLCADAATAAALGLPGARIASAPPVPAPSPTADQESV